MIVGRAWKVRRNPRESSPYSFYVPGGRASLPKRNSAPAEAEPKTCTMSFKYRKTFAPAGIRKIKAAKNEL